MLATIFHFTPIMSKVNTSRINLTFKWIDWICWTPWCYWRQKFKYTTWVPLDANTPNPILIETPHPLRVKHASSWFSTFDPHHTTPIKYRGQIKKSNRTTPTHLRATSHTKLTARDHCILRSLVGQKSQDHPSLLYTKRQTPKDPTKLS